MKRFLTFKYWAEELKTPVEKNHCSTIVALIAGAIGASMATWLLPKTSWLFFLGIVGTYIICFLIVKIIMASLFEK